LKLQPNDSLGKQLATVLRKRAEQAAANVPITAAAWPSPPAKSVFGYPIEAVSQFQRIQIGQGAASKIAGATDRFCVAIGLALQALGKSPLQINLLPREKGGVLSFLRSKTSTRSTAWGIDLGRSAIKAVQLSLTDDDRVAVVNTEFI